MRKELLAFAEIMERKLKENDHKGGWEDCTLGWLMRRLDEEREEVDGAASNLLSHIYASSPNEEINKAADELIAELADVANFAMMAADRARRLLK